MPFYWISEYWLVLCYSLVLLKMCFFPKLREHSKDIILTISEISGFTLLCWKVLWPDPVQSTRLRNQYWKAQTLGRTMKQVIACKALYGTAQHRPRNKIKGCTYLWITILKWSYYKISINSSGCEHGWYFCYLEVNRKPLYLLHQSPGDSRSQNSTFVWEMRIRKS